jgi:hypothetical protein
MGAPMDFTPIKVEFGDDVDEAMTKPFHTAIDQINKGFMQLHASRQQVQQELSAMNLLRRLADFDGYVNGLGDEWTGDYGTGATISMDPESAAFKKRMEVFNGAGPLQADAGRRRQRLGDVDAWNRSHHGVHWDRIAEHERKKLDGKVAARKKGFGERPTKGKPGTMSPRDAAIAALE